MVLTENEEFQLKKMIEANDTKDMTTKIRDNKHSGKIRECINSIIKAKNENLEIFKTDKKRFEELVSTSAGFLFYSYTDIYNKIIKDEINMTTLNKLLDILKMIEDNKVDQHEASFMVGTILKEMYVDSTLKRAEKLDKESEKQPKAEPKNISWSKYKKTHT